MMNLEQRVVVCEDIGRQLSLGEERVMPRQLSEEIEALRVEDLQRVAREMILRPPTILALGKEEALKSVVGTEHVAHYFRDVSAKRGQM